MTKRKGQKDKQHNGQKKRDRRTSNTMAKQKGKEGQATQWPKETGQKDKQHNDQKKRDRRTSNTMATRKVK
jgi:hypothetical protein